MTNTKRLIAVILCLALVFTMMPAITYAKDTNIIFSEPFDGVATNGTSDKITVTGEKSRIIDVGNKNKAMQVLGGDTTTVKVPFSTSAKKYVISFDIMGDSRITGKVSLGSGTADMPVVVITDNMITTDKGKRAGSINYTTFTRIALAINKKTGTYTLYVNMKQN